MQTIIFNGKTYNSIEEMPAHERQAFEQVSQMFVDANGNGIPDFLEGDMIKNVITARSTQANINVNGQTYNSFNELPPEMRQKVDGAFKMLSNMGFLDGAPDSQNQPVSPEMPKKTKPIVSAQSPSAIEEDRGASIFPMVLGGIVLCFAVVVITFAVFYFMNR
jgi:hypothetical protein